MVGIVKKTVVSKKIIALLFFTFIFIILGQFSGGFVFFKLTDIPIEYLTFTSLYNNWYEYSGNSDFIKQLKISVFSAFLTSLIPVISVILYKFFTMSREEIHGSARFANDSELSKSGLFPAKGKPRKYPSILLGRMPNGRFKNRFVELVGQTFVGVSAPTGSGKGVSIALPNLLNYSDSILTSDIKFDNFAKSAGFRKKQGQEVFLFAPDGYAVNEEERENGILRSHRWNPYHYVRRNDAYKMGDIQIMANSLYPLSGDGKSDTWIASASKLFVGLSLWMIETENITKKTPTLPYLYKLSGVEGGLENWLKSEVKQSYLSGECLRELNVYLSFPPETQKSVMLSFNTPLGIYANPTVAKAVGGNDFDFNDLRRKGMTIYFGVQPPQLKNYQGLLNLFMEQFINENTRVVPDLDKTLTHQCLALLDEFPALGRINQVKTSIGFTRQYNLRYLFIYQDISQLEDKALYGKEGAELITENLDVEIIFPPKKVNARVKQISETLGTKTVVVRGKGKSRGKNVNKSINDNLQKRELMKPHEIVELGHEKFKGTDIGLKTLLLKENQRAFVMDKLIYFDEKTLLERSEYSLNNIPQIPLL